MPRKQTYHCSKCGKRVRTKKLPTAISLAHNGCPSKIQGILKLKEKP